MVHIKRAQTENSELTSQRNGLEEMELNGEDSGNCREMTEGNRKTSLTEMWLCMTLCLEGGHRCIIRSCDFLRHSILGAQSCSLTRLHVENIGL